MTGFTNFFLLMFLGWRLEFWVAKRYPGYHLPRKASISSENDIDNTVRVCKAYHWIHHACECMRNRRRGLVLSISSILGKPNIVA